MTYADTLSKLDHAFELVDLDYANDLIDESLLIETLREGGLLVRTFKHPDHGILNAIHTGSAALIVQGDYLDLRTA